MSGRFELSRDKAFINSHVSVEKLPTESAFETETEFETFEMFMPQMLPSFSAAYASANHFDFATRTRNSIN